MRNKKAIALRGYKSELFDNEIIKIENQLDLEITSYTEKEPLGECGALWQIRNQINSKDLLFVLGILFLMWIFKDLLIFMKDLIASLV